MAANLVQFVTLFIFLQSCGQLVEAATFNFSVATLDVSEDAQLSRILFINKTGGNTVEPISFRVTVIQGTATPMSDYTPNADHVYTFNSGTTSLPVQTQLITDRAGEGIEYFRICLPDLQPVGAEAVDPTCVNITIIDDDSVVIGFQDGSTSVDITEGDPPQMICAEVKSFGLDLDPFDSVPLDLRTVPGAGVMLGTSSFTFTAANTVRCTTVSVTNNNLVDGTRTSQVMLAERSPPTTTVPTELYPASSQVIINDDESDVIRFRFDTQAAQRVYNLTEGETLSNIGILKYGGATSLNFTVTPVMVPINSTTLLSLADINVIGARFASSVLDGNVMVESLYDSEIAEPRHFNLSIDKSSIRADNGVNNISGVNILIEGEPISVTVYDNDFEVGFAQDTVPTSREVCVKIYNPRGVHPNTYISLSIMVKTSASPTGVALDMNNVTLNATNIMGCANVRFDDDMCRVATLELFRTNDSANIIRFLRNSTAITCRATTSDAVAVGVTVPVVLVLIAIIIIIIIVVLVLIKKKIIRLKYSKPRSRPSTDHNTSTLLEIAMDKNIAYTSRSVPNDALRQDPLTLQPPPNANATQCQPDNFALGDQPIIDSHALGVDQIGQTVQPSADESAPREDKQIQSLPYSMTPGVDQTQAPDDKSAQGQIAQLPPYSNAPRVSQTVPLQPVKPARPTTGFTNYSSRNARGVDQIRTIQLPMAYVKPAQGEDQPTAH